MDNNETERPVEKRVKDFRSDMDKTEELMAKINPRLCTDKSKIARQDNNNPYNRK